VPGICSGAFSSGRDDLDFAPPQQTGIGHVVDGGRHTWLRMVESDLG